MNQLTLFSNSFFVKHYQRDDSQGITKLLFQVVNKEAHWKLQLLCQLKNKLLTGLSVLINSISEKGIVFSVPHPAILEKVLPITNVLLCEIREILSAPCPCKLLCKKGPLGALKINFIVQYKGSGSQGPESLSSKSTAKRYSSTNAKYDRSIVDSLSNIGLKEALMPYYKKLSGHKEQ